MRSISHAKYWRRGGLVAGLLMFTVGLVPSRVNGTVVINEIHYHPEQKKPLEFVELFNSGGMPVDLKGWTLDKFEFRESVQIAPGGYLVLASDPAAFKAAFGIAAHAKLKGPLKYRGEKIALKNAQGLVVDEVRYRAGFPWPAAAAGAGSSMERISPTLQGSDPGAWRSSGYAATVPVTLAAAARRLATLVPFGSDKWHYAKGTAEPSQPRDAWRKLGFTQDKSWLPAKLPIGYGDDDDATVLTDMAGKYSTLFLRHTFQYAGVTDAKGAVKKPAQLPAGLQLRVRVDDGCIIWLNGVELARLHVPAGDLALHALAENHEAEMVPEEVYVPNAPGSLKLGDNVLAVQVFNSALASSDLTFDMELLTSDTAPAGDVTAATAVASKRPTPGQRNSCAAENVPPTIEAVSHLPRQPKSGERVHVSARVTDPDGVGEVSLFVQTVAPGNYIRKKDAGYENGWQPYPMRDDGREGDRTPGDGVFTVLLPLELPKHRHLYRYRVTAVDRGGRGVRAPYPDDPSPNFAWFCYDGESAWSGASQPGKTPVLNYPASFFHTLPAYRLIAQEGDVARSQWDGNFHRQPFQGTFVYDGEVYDHITFHNRGQGSTYIAGKNKWGLRFNPTHDVAGRDDLGRLHPAPWNSINLNPGIYTPYTPVHRGIAGLDEAVTFRSQRLAGVPSSATQWVQWHVIDGAAESTPGNQYEGDLWGLYLAIEDMDGPFLKNQNLDDGVVMSIQSGLKHRPRDEPSAQQLWDKFRAAMRSNPSEAWWRENLDLPAYYSFHALNRLLANVDLRPDGNHGYYRAPDGRWAPIPWDNDMMFVPRHHQPGYIEAIACLNHPAIKLEYQGRAREILDLFASDPSPTGGQIGQLVADLGRVLVPLSQPVSWPQLDEAVWNWNPRMNEKGLYFRNPAQGGHFGGPWQRTLSTPDIAGFQNYIVRFCTDSRTDKKFTPNDGNPVGYGWGYLAFEARDEKIPKQPTLVERPSPGAATRVFAVSPFESPAGHRAVAVEYRVGRVLTKGVTGWKRGMPERYELEEVWRTPVEERAAALAHGQASIPAKAFAGPGLTRVRVRYQDHTGRWSHWSAPANAEQK